MQNHLSDEPILGTTKGPCPLESTSEIMEASCKMADQARRELLMLGRTLDPALYDQRAFLASVQRLALSRPQIAVRVLTGDPKGAGRKHRLIELSRRLTSRIEIRCVSAEDQGRLDAFLVADECGYISRRLADHMEAVCDFDDPGEARRLKADFDEVWNRADSDPDLRRLFI